MEIILNRVEVINIKCKMFYDIIKCVAVCIQNNVHHLMYVSGILLFI